MEPLPLIGIDEGDVADIHGKIANAMRAIGLTGHALDEACAEAFRSTAVIVMRERKAQENRENGLRLVP